MAKANCRRNYSDISTINHKGGEEIIPRNYWHIMVDERTGHKVSNLYDAKVVWWSQHGLILRCGDKPPACEGSLIRQCCREQETIS